MQQEKNYDDDVGKLYQGVLGSPCSDWVKLNVGGKIFATTRSTLTTREPNSMLARMFAIDQEVTWSSHKDENGAFLIDRSAHYFEPILNYLRHGEIILDKNMNVKGILEEAKFYGLQHLIDMLEKMPSVNVDGVDKRPISRHELILLVSASRKELCHSLQGLDFTNADLSKLNLSQISFEGAVMRNTNLTRANLSRSHFQGADMSRAILDGCDLICANLQEAKLQHASLQYANLQNADLRRANLTNCILTDCNLDSANLQGANLQGANLQGANLQGANLQGTSLER